jgi:hypothetical protein
LNPKWAHQGFNGTIREAWRVAAGPLYRLVMHDSLKGVTVGIDEKDRAQRPTGWGTRAILLLAMVLAAITAVGGSIAVYKAVFVYSVT